MFLLLIALFGFFVPNGLFLYWLFFEPYTLTDIISNKLALAFIIDASMVMFLLAYWFTVKPIGKIRWYWFIVLSIIGGLGFSLPFYYWLNMKKNENKT